jgi:hypothetical protein
MTAGVLGTGRLLPAVSTTGRLSGLHLEAPAQILKVAVAGVGYDIWKRSSPSSTTERWLRDFPSFFKSQRGVSQDLKALETEIGGNARPKRPVRRAHPGRTQRCCRDRYSVM